MPPSNAPTLPKQLEGWSGSPDLPDGCYIVHYTPAGFPAAHYDGTLRVWRVPGTTGITASGDLYAHRKEPDPSAGIPTFPVEGYAFYLKVVEWRRSSPNLVMKYHLYAFRQASGLFSTSETFSALLTQAPTPAGRRGPYFIAEVKDDAGHPRGRMTIQWVCSSLRKVGLEIATVGREVNPPDNNGLPADPKDWLTVFREVGWDISVRHSAARLSEDVERDGVWSLGELHRGMETLRRTTANDQWRFHLLCVPKIQNSQRTHPAGIMFDVNGTDANPPREAAAIAARNSFDTQLKWASLIRGKMLQEVAQAYFRTAVHEVGHGLNLSHSNAGRGYMTPTGDVAQLGVDEPDSRKFPANIEWRYSPTDQEKLRHLPDIYVRPGGVPFEDSGGAVEDVEDEAEQVPNLYLNVAALQDVIPMGAPARVHFSLRNQAGDGADSVQLPKDLSLKGGHIRGRVIGPFGDARTFTSILLCLDCDDPLAPLPPGGQQGYDVTLLRGAQRALFPAPGIYRVIIECSWGDNGIKRRVSGETNLMVLPPKDEAHARATLTILSSPDALLALAIGVDDLPEAREAIDSCIGNPDLRPHYAIVQAKLEGSPLRDKGGHELLDHEAVNILSGAELRRAGELADRIKETDARNAFRQLLRDRAKGLSAANRLSGDLEAEVWEIVNRDD